jgi:hypothetical protein
VTTADRIDTIGYRAWLPVALPTTTPPVAVPDGQIYVGTHRRTGISRRMSLLRMFYKPRHRV